MNIKSMSPGQSNIISCRFCLCNITLSLKLSIQYMKRWVSQVKGVSKIPKSMMLPYAHFDFRPIVGHGFSKYVLCLYKPLHLFLSSWFHFNLTPCITLNIILYIYSTFNLPGLLNEQYSHNMLHLLGCCDISKFITVSIYVACYLENYTHAYCLPLIILISGATDASHSCNFLAGVKCVQVLLFFCLFFRMPQIALHFDWGVFEDIFFFLILEKASSS